LAELQQNDKMLQMDDISPEQKGMYDNGGKENANGESIFLLARHKKITHFPFL
jgi:hypothetical protein